MSRLTEKEIELIQSARAARQPNSASADQFVQKARALQSDFAAEAVGHGLKASGLATLGSWLYATFVSPITDAMNRRRTVQQLSRLDDHLLADIGLERGLVENFGEELSARTVASHRAVEGPVTRLRRWLHRRRSVNELRGLSNRMLDDIGIQPGDIESVIEKAMQDEADLRQAKENRIAVATAEALSYVDLKVDPPFRPQGARRVEPGFGGKQASVLPMWLGPWLPPRGREVA